MSAARRGESLAAAGMLAAIAGVGIVGGAACIVSAPPASLPVSQVVDYPMRRLDLRDGSRVLLEQAPDFGRAAAVLIIGAGSADEPAEKAGLAHLTEHLVFEAAHGGVSLEEKLRDLADGTNAGTSWDRTWFYSVDDARSLDELLTFMRGVVEEPLAGIDQRHFEREWQVVAQEMRMRTENGTPGQAVGWLMSAVFPHGHPYAHSVVGTPETLARITFDDVRAFAAARYRPQASTLVVSAPLALADQQALLERVSGQPAQAGPAPPQETNRPLLSAVPPSFEIQHADVPTPTLWVGWSVPPDSTPQGDLAPLMALLMQQDFSYDLTEQDHDVAGVRAGVADGTQASLLYVEAALKDGSHPEATARMIGDALSGAGAGRLALLDISLPELTRSVAAGFVYGEEGMLDRALGLAFSYQQLGAPLYLRGRGERMARAAAGDLQAYAREFLSPSRAHVVLVRPFAGAPPPMPVLARAAPAGGPVAAAAFAAARPEPAASPAAAAAPGPRARPAAPPRKLLARLETHDLPNGMRLILLPRPGAAFHTVLLGFDGGYAQAKPPGVITATAWARYSPQTSPSVWGIDYRTRATANATMEVLRATGSDVRTTLKHLQRMLGFSTFWPPRRFNRMVEVFEREDRAPPEALERTLLHATFGDHPLGAFPTAKQLQKITPAEVNRWVSLVRRPRNAALVIVGDFDAREVLAAATAEIGHWAEDAPASREVENPPLLEELAAGAGEHLYLQDRPGAQQATLRFRCMLPAATPETVGAHAIFGHGLRRAMFGSLREEMGASYSVHGNVQVLAGGTAVFDLSADVDYPLLPRALRRLRALLAQPGAGLLAGEQLARTRRSVAGSFQAEEGTSLDVANSLFRMWSLDWPLDTSDRMPERVLATPDAEVARVADHCRDSWVVGLLGDRRRTRQAWDESAP